MFREIGTKKELKLNQKMGIYANVKVNRHSIVNGTAVLTVNAVKSLSAELKRLKNMAVSIV